MKKAKIAVLVSGSGTNLQAILDACATGKINGEVVCVGSDNPEAFGLVRAQKAEIPTFILDYKETRRRLLSGIIDAPTDLNGCYEGPRLMQNLDEWERIRIRSTVEAEFLKTLYYFKVDFLVCAGFMRIFTKYFLDHFQPDLMRPRIMNIHPALLPAFAGTDGYGDAWRYGVKVYGPTVHFVNHDVDTGPIIGQTSLKREEEDTFEYFKERGLQAEYALYPKCIQRFIERRLQIENGENGRKVVYILPPKKFNPR